MDQMDLDRDHLLGNFGSDQTEKSESPDQTR